MLCPEHLPGTFFLFLFLLLIFCACVCLILVIGTSGPALLSRLHRHGCQEIRTRESMHTITLIVGAQENTPCSIIGRLIRVVCSLTAVL